MVKAVRVYKAKLIHSSHWPRSAGPLAFLLLCLLLTACEPGSNLAPLPSRTEGPYRLGVDDQVRIIIFGQDQLTGQFRVNDRGNVAISLIGSIPASGKTTSELEHYIEQSFKDKNLLADPKVSVEVVAYRPIFILGEVTKPGQYPYQPDMTVLTAVAVAGGFTYRAQTDYASILRTDDGKSTEGRVDRGTPVHAGDVITILQRYF
jgi:polysaccharide export outer membrane protein